jgi:hypothetical protein
MMFTIRSRCYIEKSLNENTILFDLVKTNNHISGHAINLPTIRYERHQVLLLKP